MVKDVLFNDLYQCKKTLKCSPEKCGQVKLASPIRSKNIQKPETCGFVPGRNLDLFRRSVCIFQPARSVFVAARVDPDPFKKPQFCNPPLLVFISAIIIILVVIEPKFLPSIIIDTEVVAKNARF